MKNLSLLSGAPSSIPECHWAPHLTNVYVADQSLTIISVITITIRQYWHVACHSGVVLAIILIINNSHARKQQALLQQEILANILIFRWRHRNKLLVQLTCVATLRVFLVAYELSGILTILKLQMNH